MSNVLTSLHDGASERFNARLCVCTVLAQVYGARSGTQVAISLEYDVRKLARAACVMCFALRGDCFVDCYRSSSS